MKEQIEQFLEYITVEKEYSPNTLAAYRNDLSQFATFAEKRAIHWNQVRHDTILAYVMAMKGDQEYASATVARKVAAIKSFFHYLVKKGLLKDDPTAALDSPKVNKRPPRAISADDVDLLLSEPARTESARALRDRALLELLYATGMRATEIISLNLDDINLASATVRVTRRRGKKERVIPVHERAIEPLQAYLERGRLQLLQTPEERALFVNHRGERLTRQGLWLIVKHYVREVGIAESVTPHTLRHTFAAHLLDKKAKIEYVQQILGHSNLSTTQAYTQASVEDSRRTTTGGDER